MINAPFTKSYLDAWVEWRRQRNRLHSREAGLQVTGKVAVDLVRDPPAEAAPMCVAGNRCTGLEDRRGEELKENCLYLLNSAFSFPYSSEDDNRIIGVTKILLTLLIVSVCGSRRRLSLVGRLG